MIRDAISAHDFGRVGVLMGGVTERDVSLHSGKLVLAALRERGVDAHPIVVEAELIPALQTAHVDRVFNILHGGSGEGGIVQGILCALGIPYTDSSVLASSLALDKERTKWLCHGIGIPTPDYLAIDAGTRVDAVITRLGLPFVVKPMDGGSSLGVSIVKQALEFTAAVASARQYSERIMAEYFIAGRELTVGILDNEALPVIAIEVAQGFYDYTAKYHADDTRYLCPAGLDDAQEAKARALALRVFTAVGCSHWGRVDLLEDQQQNLWLLEVNTIPGMTDHSLVPKAAKAIGIEYPELIWRILATTL